MEERCSCGPNGQPKARQRQHSACSRALRLRSCLCCATWRAVHANWRAQGPFGKFGVGKGPVTAPAEAAADAAPAAAKGNEVTDEH